MSSYILYIARNGMRLYGSRIDDRGNCQVYEDVDSQAVDRLLDPGAPAATKADVRLGVIFSDIFSLGERDVKLRELRQMGFGFVAEYDFNRYLCQAVKAHPYAMIVSADGEDLMWKLFRTHDKQSLSMTKVDGAGVDPRVKVLADKVWSKLIDEYRYLDKDKDFGEVMKEAGKFLATNRSEWEGKIYLEGEDRYFFVRRCDADIDNNIDYGGSTIQAALNTFAQKNELDKQSTVMILSMGVSGNPYFHDVFNGYVPSLRDIDTDGLRLPILTGIMEDLSGMDALGGSAVIADELPVSNLHAKPREDAIEFKVNFPAGVKSVEVYRDDTKVKTMTQSLFTDEGLLPDHAYSYTFKLVLTDDNGYERRSRGLSRTISTTPVQMPDPVVLQMTEHEDKCVLSWDAPSRGNLRIYVSDSPFPLVANDRVSASDMKYKVVRTLDTSHTVEKNYCGEHFYLPVTFIGEQGIVGTQCVVKSMVMPKGIRIDATNVAHVKVVWIWDGMQAVRVKWLTNDGNEKWVDVPNEGQVPEQELSSVAQNGNVKVFVSAIHKTHDDELLESEEVVQTVMLSPVSIRFVEAKSNARLFRPSNEYSIVLQADREPPCDLYVLIGEGAMPMDLTNFKSHLTISPADLQGGQPKKFTLNYERMQKKQTLFFRVIAADRTLPIRVLPECKQV